VMTRVEGHLFRSNGSMPVVEGWRALYRDEKQDVKKKRGGDEKQEGEENPLPKLEVGDERKVEKTVVEKKQTKPPAPHTDASILDLMENAGQNIEDETLREQMKSSGLGTPATRAAVIERLIQVGYARRKGKTIVSTEKGRQLIAVVPEQISSAVTTGKWEKALSAMAAFKDEEARMAKSDRFMQGIRRFSIFLVDAAKNAPRDVHFEKETPKKYAARRTTARKASAAKSGQGNN